MTQNTENLPVSSKLYHGAARMAHVLGVCIIFTLIDIVFLDHTLRAVIFTLVSLLAMSAVTVAIGWERYRRGN